MPTPNQSQGTLNRLRVSVVWNDHPELNITPAFLGESGVSLSFLGEATTFLGTLTGRAQSPEPYQGILLRVELLKTQQLADLYKARRELDASLGDGTIRPDSITLSPWQVTNCAIVNVRDLSFNGRVVGYEVEIGGTYLVNSSLWG